MLVPPRTPGPKASIIVLPSSSAVIHAQESETTFPGEEIAAAIEPVARWLADQLTRLTGNLLFILLAFMAVVVFWSLGAVIGRQPWLFSRIGTNVLPQGLVRQLTKFLFVFAGMLIAFEILGLSSLIGAVAGAAGVAGLALGFAFREIIENYLAGVLLSVQSPFTIGDWVAVGDIEGSVMRLTTRNWC